MLDDGDLAGAIAGLKPERATGEGRHPRAASTT